MHEFAGVRLVIALCLAFQALLDGLLDLGQAFKAVLDGFKALIGLLRE
jgi:hypothetical protein